MSNSLYCDLDVLASDEMEMSRVAQRLCQPSADLVDWVAEDSVFAPEKATEWLTKLLDFETADNLGSVDEKENKARRFKLSTKVKFFGIIRRHLTEISEAFPKCVLLLEYRDLQWSFSAREVIRGVR